MRAWLLFAILICAGFAICSCDDSFDLDDLVPEANGIDAQSNLTKIQIDSIFEMTEKTQDKSVGSAGIIKRLKDKVKSGVKKAVNISTTKIKKGISIAVDGMDAIIAKSRLGLQRAAAKISQLHLPNISLPISIPKPKISSLNIGMLPCIITMKAAFPGLITFVKSAAKSKADDAITSLIGILKFMPDISGKCMGKTFEIPPSVMDKTKCMVDIIELSKSVSVVVATPMNVITDFFNVKEVIELVPKTISECTGAFL